MSISKKMTEFAARSSWIRKMFEEGAKMKHEFGADNIYDFSLGNPDLPPPPEYDKSVKEIALLEGQGVHGYMPNGGYPYVREAVAGQVGDEQGVPLGMGEILMTCGAAGAINVVMKSLLNPGDEVIILAPFFVEYNFYIDNNGGVSKIVQTGDDFSLDIAAISEAITDKTKAIIINSPNNPTGQIYPARDLSALGELLSTASDKNNSTIYLVADEPYRKIVFDGFVVPGVLEAYDNSIVVSSYSKDLSLPGERIGYIAIHPDIAQKKALCDAMTLANRILGFVNAPAFMQRVIADLQGVTVDTSVYQKRRETFCKILSDIGYDFVAPKGAFYLFPKSPLEDDVEFVSLLQKQKILAVPGRGFGKPGYFRLAFCVDDSVIEGSKDAFAKAFAEAKKS